MKLADREDLSLVPPVVLARIVGWYRAATPRRVLARFLARLAYRFSRQKRRRIERALDLAFGVALSPQARKTIALGSLRGVWDELFRHVAGPNARGEFDNCEFRGLDHLRASLSRGRGAILWDSNGLGPRMMPKRLLKELGFAIRQIHAHNHIGGLLVSDAAGSLVRARWLRPFLQRREDYFVSGLMFFTWDLLLADLRELERRLGRNEVICIAADGSLGHGTLSLPLLGSHARFASGMVNLAKVTGAELLPLFCVERPEGGFLLTIEEPVPLSSSRDRKERVHAAISHYSRLLETYIRRYPNQYRNWHLLASDADGD